MAPRAQAAAAHPGAPPPQPGLCCDRDKEREGGRSRLAAALERRGALASVLQQEEWLDGARDEYDDERTFACRHAYHPGTSEFRPLSGASSLAEAVAAAGLEGEEQDDDDEDEDEEDEESAAAAGLSRFAKAARRLKPSARPKQLPCRERNLEEVAGSLREAVREGGLGCALYLSGTPGTGKTATVRQASRRVGRPGPAAAQPSLCAGRRPRSRPPPLSEGPRRSLYVPFECSLGRLGAEAVEALPGPATEMGGGGSPRPAACT